MTSKPKKSESTPIHEMVVPAGVAIAVILMHGSVLHPGCSDARTMTDCAEQNFVDLTLEEALTGKEKERNDVSFTA